MKLSRHFPSPRLRRGGRKGGLGWVGGSSVQLGVFEGKVPPGIVWLMVWSEAAGLWGWSWKCTSTLSTFGQRERLVKSAEPQQHWHLRVPPGDDHVQRQAPQPEMWVRLLRTETRRRLFILSALFNWCCRLVSFQFLYSVWGLLCVFSVGSCLLNWA